jgi:hypothetical protein
MSEPIEDQTKVGPPSEHAFQKELENLIKRHSLDYSSITPCFILGDFLTDILLAFNRAVTRREDWYSRGKEPVDPSEG